MNIFLENNYNESWPIVLWDTSPSDQRHHCIVCVSGSSHSTPGTLSIERYIKVAPRGDDYE